MKKSAVIFAVISLSSLMVIQACRQNNDTYNQLVEIFKNPTKEAHPKVYWWCLNGNIDTIRAKKELHCMKEAGIRGFDFIEIGVPDGDTMITGGPAFLSDESLKIIKSVVNEAGRLGLTVGLNPASSWNAGGSWTKPENGGKSLYFSKLELKGTSKKQSIKIPFPEITFSERSVVGRIDKRLIPFRKNGRPVYYEDIALLAIPDNVETNSLDTAKVIDLTPYFNPETDELNWKVPTGKWNIHRYVCSNSGQQLVLPSPLSAGLTIDHFDSTAVETHLEYVLNRLSSVLGDFRKTALKNIYLPSYEARGFVWTSSLENEFKKVNGYDIRKFIPALYDQKLFNQEINKQVQIDFRKTLSELIINNLYRKSKEICNSYGLKINSEAGGPGYPLYNGSADPLKAQGALDIPRGEFWINYANFYLDSNGKDSINVLQVVKEAAAASHIYEKGIVEEEAFTSFQHWQEGPFDMKPYGDRAFCEGMNKVVFHGFPHNISGSGFPGYSYHAGTHFNDKRVWWPKAKPFIKYLTRISAITQNTNFVSDVLWYYGDKIPNAAAAKNTHFKAGPGYDYEVINTDILINNLEVKNGKLVLPNGASFSLLALENEESINPKVLKKLNELIKQGAVIIGEKPKKVTQLANYPALTSESETLLNQLWGDASDKVQSSFNTNEKIWAGITPSEMLQVLRVSPDINYKGKEHYLLDFIHYNKNELDVYFICNPKNEWISRNVGFRVNKKVPEIWDPVSGEIIPVNVYKQNNEYTELPLSLAPYGSLLLIFKKSNKTPRYNEIAGNKQYPPVMKYTKDGICFLQNENIILKKQSQSESIQNEIQSLSLNGPWEVSFTKGWGAPEKVSFPKLISWTDSEIKGIKYYSGTATYKKTFEYNHEKEKDKKIYLHLGEVSKVSEVWLNGQKVGISWTKPHQFDVTNMLKPGENTLRVEIANTWSNRLTGDAITGEKYTNTNISNTVIPSPTMRVGNRTRYSWAEVPLIKSGLIGPVLLVTIKPVS